MAPAPCGHQGQTGDGQAGWVLWVSQAIRRCLESGKHRTQGTEWREGSGAGALVTLPRGTEKAPRRR